MSIEWVLTPAPEPAYDIEVDEDAGYIANGVVVHNTMICRYMDGKEFSVSGSLDMLKRTMAASNPEDIRTLQPWVERGRDENGEQYLYFKRADGSRQVIADVVRSGVGRMDDRGDFRSRMSDAKLESSGISMPPLHRTCRSTIVTITS